MAVFDLINATISGEVSFLSAFLSPGHFIFEPQAERQVIRLYFALLKTSGQKPSENVSSYILKNWLLHKIWQNETSDENKDGNELGLVDRVTLWTFGIDQI